MPAAYPPGPCSVKEGMVSGPREIWAAGVSGGHSLKGGKQKQISRKHDLSSAYLSLVQGIRRDGPPWRPPATRHQPRVPGSGPSASRGWRRQASPAPAPPAAPPPALAS